LVVVVMYGIGVFGGGGDVLRWRCVALWWW